MIAQAVARDEFRLRAFIRRQVSDRSDADDILQDVFYEFISAYRLMKPAELATAWLFRVARNRITDLFRKKKTVSLNDAAAAHGDSEDERVLEDFLPSSDAGPDAIYARNVFFDALDDALEELPDKQREVFIAHELDGLSFKEIAAETGVSVNTLLSRKRYAVLHLRERLAEMKRFYETR